MTKLTLNCEAIDGSTGHLHFFRSKALPSGPTPLGNPGSRLAGKRVKDLQHDHVAWQGVDEIFFLMTLTRSYRAVNIAAMQAQQRQEKSGVYAGSFDPLTVGHMWMIEQGARLFDRLVVAVGVNPEKKYTFALEDRLDMLRESTSRYSNVSVAALSNHYLIHYAQLVGATHILRGIRTESDYEFERTMRNVNGDLDGKICTVFLMPPRGIAEVSSSMVRGLIGPIGWHKIVRKYVPQPVYQRLVKSNK